jgi:coproporphyrinogen III oxidase
MDSIQKIIWSERFEAKRALELVIRLQKFFATELESLGGDFRSVSWARDAGRHGGGERFESQDGEFFNRGSINISQVQYEDDPKRPLESATALSAIVHPNDPRHPSLHLHISFTQRKGEEGTWRMMGDLNPSQPTEDGNEFRKALKKFDIQVDVDAFAQGDHYFWIPALERHRGVCHFYLEAYRGQDFETDLQLAEDFGMKTISTYAELLKTKFEGAASTEQKIRQRKYHTLYFFQVLLLDRGTTAGVLVHDQNDEGILGSLPARVDLPLLKSWHSKLPEMQGLLLEKMIAVLDEGGGAIDGGVKQQLARTLRLFYKSQPEALKFQAKALSTAETSSPHLPS